MLVVFLLSSLLMMAQDEDEYSIPGEYIVQLNGSVNSEFFFSSSSYNIRIKECLSKSMNIWLIQSGTADLLSALRSSTQVRAAQYNHSHITHRSIIPNDSLFNMQWNLLNTSNPGDDISATKAWQLNHSNLTRMGDSIVIAVVDGGLGSGFDIYHPDINFFINHHEIPNNGIDDDGNGYIDDYHGWNVFTNNDSVYSTSDPHATHVSGIAAAKGNNSIGIAGVCWGVKVLAVNAASNTESDVVKAYDYVLEMRKLYDQTAGAKGALIVATNSSFGVGNYGANPINYPIWCAMYDSLGKYGILSSVAVPDFAVNVDAVNDVPTGCPSRWMMSVTNTTRTDGLNSQAGYGPTTVDIGAPGTSITSCYPDSAYGYDAGTSMSCPHLTGAVASLFANACPRLLQDYFAYPDSISLIMRDYLLHSADPLSSLQNITTTGGRLNLYHAFIAEDAYNCNNCNYNLSLSQQNLTCIGDSNASITLTAGTNNTKYHYLWSNGDTVSRPTALKAGFYQVTVTDSAGCQRQLSTLIPMPHTIVVSSITVIPMTGASSGNIIVSAAAGSDSMYYAMDTGSYQAGAIFVTNTPGVHIIHIRNQSGCVMDTPVAIYYAGINNISETTSIILSPNPTAGQAILTIRSEAEMSADLCIHDMSGRVISATKIQITKGTQQKQVDLSMLSNGLYLMSLTRDGEKLTEMKVMLIK